MNLKNAIEALSALAQDTRLAVFRLLVRGGGLNGGDRLSDLGVEPGVDGFDEAERTEVNDTDVGIGAGGIAALSAGFIAGHLKVPPATLSFHLAKLEHAGLIKAQRRGLNIFYSADHAGIRALLGFLTDDCCQGRPELCGVRLQAEKS